MKKTFKELLDEVSDYDRIPVPDALKFPTTGKYRKFLQGIVSKIDDYHRAKDEEDLKRSLVLTLRVVEMLMDDLTEQQLNHRHEVRVLKHKLSSFISIKKPKEDEDAPEKF